MNLIGRFDSRERYGGRTEVVGGMSRSQKKMHTSCIDKGVTSLR